MGSVAGLLLRMFCAARCAVVQLEHPGRQLLVVAHAVGELVQAAAARGAAYLVVRAAHFGGALLPLRVGPKLVCFCGWF